MATLLDGQVMLVPEVTWNTPVTVTRSHEVLSSSKHNWDPMVMQGIGLRVGQRFDRGGRRLPGSGQAALTLVCEVASKGMGLLLAQAAGVGVSTLVSASTYQENFTPLITTPFMPSCTIQFGIVRDDATGTVDAYTYSGCTAQKWTLECSSQNDIATLSVDFWAAALSTAIGLATPAFPATPSLFSGALASTTLGGALTMPTTTTLVTGGTAATDVRSWSLAVDNGVTTRPRLGGWNQPVAGKPKATLKIDMDYDVTTVRAAEIAQTATSFSTTLTAGALGTGVETLALALPAIYVSDGSNGPLSAGEAPVPSITFDVLSDLTNTPYVVSTRTADAAL